MKVTIENKGLKTLLYTLLSCRCPVTPETEALLFKEFFRVQKEDQIDYDAMLKIADGNPQKTPLHLLRDFCSYSKDDPSSFLITHNDVIRYVCTKFHFRYVVAALDPLVVTDTSSFILSHLLLPAVVERDGNRIEAQYRSGGRSIRFKNMVFMPGLEWIKDGSYGIHLGSVVTELNRQQVRMIEDHLGLIEQSAQLIADVGEVDFKNFQHYGDYSAQVMRRVERNFPR
jgi:hypothetical protein